MALSPEELSQRALLNATQRRNNLKPYTKFNINNDTFKLIDQNLASVQAKEKRKLKTYSNERERVRQEDLNTFQNRENSFKRSQAERSAMLLQGSRGAQLGSVGLNNLGLSLGVPNQAKTILGL